MTLPVSASLERVRAALAPLDAPPSLVGPWAEVEPRLGAVMLLLYPRAEEVHFLLERRPSDVPEHAGQISLPGGGFRAADGSFLATAQRETFEELGIAAERYEVWGRLEPIRISVSNFVVVPFVGFAPHPPSLRPDTREVADVLEVPLRALVDPTSLLEEVWEIRGSRRRVAFFLHGEHKIWGATARVLGQVSAALREGPQPDGAPEPGAVLPWP